MGLFCQNWPLGLFGQNASVGFVRPKRECASDDVASIGRVTCVHHHLRARVAACRPAACLPARSRHRTASFVPAARSRPGFDLFFPPRSRGGGAPTGARVHDAHPRRAEDGHALALLRKRLRPHDAGTRASRRSTVAIFGRGRASVCGISSASLERSSSQPGRSAWRAGSLASRACGYKPQPRDATPGSANGTVSGDAPR